MDHTKLFEDLTQADLSIIQDELKAVQEFKVRALKHKDLWTVCSWLKIKGLKNASKEAMLQTIVSIYKIKERYGKLADNSVVILVATRNEPHCPFQADEHCVLWEDC